MNEDNTGKIMELNKIYALLKEKIIWLELLPETVLNLTVLAKEFKVSRTPIKEALLLLQAQGWVLHYGQHFMVTPLSINRMKDITDVRFALEMHASVWAMERITEEELFSLEQIKDEIEKLNDNASMKEMLLIDFKFHNTIYRATKNDEISKLLECYLEKYLRFWLSFPQEIIKEKFFEETLKFIKAIKDKDEDKVRESAAEHIRQTVADLNGYFSIEKDYRAIAIL